MVGHSATSVHTPLRSDKDPVFIVRVCPYSQFTLHSGQIRTLSEEELRAAVDKVHTPLRSDKDRIDFSAVQSAIDVHTPLRSDKDCYTPLPLVWWK